METALAGGDTRPEMVDFLACVVEHLVGEVPAGAQPSPLSLACLAGEALELAGQASVCMGLQLMEAAQRATGRAPDVRGTRRMEKVRAAAVGTLLARPRWLEAFMAHYQRLHPEDRVPVQALIADALFALTGQEEAGMRDDTPGGAL